MSLPYSKIKLLHVARRKLGLEDSEWRAVLSRVGVESSKDLDDQTFRIVMNHLEKCGFQSRRNVRARSNATVPETKARLTAKISALKADLGVSWNYVDGIAQRMFGIDRVEWCTPDQLFKIVQALSVHQKRKRKAVQ